MITQNVMLRMERVGKAENQNETKKEAMKCEENRNTMHKTGKRK